MNRRIGAIVAAAVIIVFVAFIVYDITSGNLFTDKPTMVTGEGIVYPEPAWQISQSIDFTEGKLWTVAVTGDNRLVAAGKGFLSLYDADLNPEWTISHDSEINALAVNESTIYLATETTIRLFSTDGTLITSISANNSYVVFADAGTRRVYVLNTEGSLISFFGHEDEKFIIPSGYFDVTILPDNSIMVVNPGKTRIEHRDIKGNIISLFGEPGIAPEAFSGCCNPSHFTMLDDQLLATSEKGISRIKIMNLAGELIEYVATPDMLPQALPLDLAADSRGRLYAASTYESRLYIFTKKE
jgi:WD40 repeat protein